ELVERFAQRIRERTQELECRSWRQRARDRTRRVDAIAGVRRGIDDEAVPRRSDAGRALARMPSICEDRGDRSWKRVETAAKRDETPARRRPFASRERSADEASVIALERGDARDRVLGRQPLRIARVDSGDEGADRLVEELRAEPSAHEARDGLVVIVCAPGDERLAKETELCARREERRTQEGEGAARKRQDRKSTRLNSSHVKISYAVFCLK